MSADTAAACLEKFVYFLKYFTEIIILDSCELVGPLCSQLFIRT